MESKVYRQWDDGYLVRRMTRNEGQQVFKWYRDLDLVLSVDLELALDIRGDNTDVDGFYVGELNGEMVASLVEAQVDINID